MEITVAKWNEKEGKLYNVPKIYFQYNFSTKIHSRLIALYYVVLKDIQCSETELETQIILWNLIKVFKTFLRI